MNILTIDLSKINNEVDRYYARNNKVPYIICSEETEKLIVSKCTIFGSKEDIERFKDKGMIGYYCGVKVLRDDKLKLGDIEVR